VDLGAVQLQMKGRCTGRCCCDELRLGTTARPLQSPWWAMTKPRPLEKTHYDYNTTVPHNACIAGSIRRNRSLPLPASLLEQLYPP
jgi:hypothetical protein